MHNAASRKKKKYFTREETTPGYTRFYYYHLYYYDGVSGNCTRMIHGRGALIFVDVQRDLRAFDDDI